MSESLRTEEPLDATVSNQFKKKKVFAKIKAVENLPGAHIFTFTTVKKKKKIEAFYISRSTRKYPTGPHPKIKSPTFVTTRQVNDARASDFLTHTQKKCQQFL